MSFVSLQFGLFFCLFLALYWAVPARRRSLLLLVGGWVFYAAWDWRFIGLILLSSLTDFVAGRGIHRATAPIRRKSWMAFTLAVNLGVLAYFKYANFFVDSFATLVSSVGLGVSTPTLQIILPVGISFYTFQTLSYSLDIYRGKLEPTESFVDFAAFVAFFPQLVAGPIVRAREFLYQLEKPRLFEWRTFESGAVRFIEGFFLKAFVADTLAVSLVDPVFSEPGAYSSSALWMAMVGYTFQIYADFAGYSSMAIGAAGMLGFSIPENFRYPYLARSFSEFWTRWHITMSRFFRDYVYIPMGGSREGQAKTVRNLAVTTLVSGLWHGASWTFVAWGGVHGFFLVLAHTLGTRVPERIRSWTPVGWAVTFGGTMVAWVLFRSASFADAWVYVKGLGGAEGAGVSPTPLVIVAAVSVLVHHAWGFVAELRPGVGERVPAFLAAAVVLALVLFAFNAMPDETAPFIYFQF